MGIARRDPADLAGHRTIVYYSLRTWLTTIRTTDVSINENSFHINLKPINHMKTTKILFTSSLMAILSAVANAQITTSFTATEPADWDVPGNWNNGVPGTGDTAVITNGREPIISSAITPVPGTIRAGNNADGGTVRISGGAISATNFQAATATGSTGHLTISGGTFTVNNSTWLSATGTVTGTSSTLNISGGTFDWGTNLNLGTTGTNVATVSGSAGTMSGTKINAGGGTSFIFNLDSEDVSAFTGTGTLNITAGASLLVDGTAFTGSLGSITLFNFDQITGSFGENVTFQNFGSLNPQLSQVGGSMMVIPEPRVYGLAIGLFALVWIVVRRRLVKS